jgi:FAD-dependent halogenase
MIADLLAPATRVRDGQYSSVRVLKDFSYANTRFWAPGAVLVDDSACFIDPVFSSGVHLATYSGLLAARSINTRLAPARNELPDEERCFIEFERRYRREYGVFYEFLLGFYDMHQDEQSYFWRARKVLEVTDAARPAFVRLVAGLSNPGEPLFDDAEAFLRSASDRAHFLQRLSDGTSSGDLPAELHDQARDFGKVFFRERKELWEVRQRKARGAPLADDQAPIWEGGLTPTPDGFHWRASV